MGGETREHGLTLLQVSEHRVAENDVTVAGLIAGLHPGLGAGRTEIDELLGMIDRERPEQHLVEHREDRRVGADAECQGKDRDRRDEWGLEKRSEGELQVAHSEDSALGIK
jgi:hypothetical protein